MIKYCYGCLKLDSKTKCTCDGWFHLCDWCQHNLSAAETRRLAELGR